MPATPDTPRSASNPSKAQKVRRRNRYGNATAKARQLAGIAMLEQGASYRTIKKSTGLAFNTIQRLRQGELISPEQTQEIKDSIERKQLLACEMALNPTLIEEKIKDARLSELGTFIKAVKPEKPTNSGNSYAFTLSQFLVQAPIKHIATSIPVASTIELSPTQQTGMDTGDKPTNT